MTMRIYSNHKKWRWSSKRYVKSYAKVMKIGWREEECKRVNMRWKMLHCEWRAKRRASKL
jgi:hypothetical protein